MELSTVEKPIELTEDQVNLLTDWTSAVSATASAKAIIEAEQVLRKKVMEALFPTPKEGTNTLILGSGYELKATYKLDRKVDEAALPAVFFQLREMGINPDPLILLKPTLDTTAYKSLAIIDGDAARIFEQALIIKPASPTIELKIPKAVRI